MMQLHKAAYRIVMIEAKPTKRSFSWRKGPNLVPRFRSTTCNARVTADAASVSFSATAAGSILCALCRIEIGEKQELEFTGLIHRQRETR